MTEGKRAKEVVVCEMSPQMELDVEKLVDDALDKYKTEQDYAEHIKQFFDKTYSPNWHCVVGRHFASYVTYTSKHYVFMYVGQLAILLYKL